MAGNNQQASRVGLVVIVSGSPMGSMETGEQAKTLESAVRTLAGSRPKHRNVLFVESDPDLQWSLARMLTVNGNRVVGTSSVEGAVAVLEHWAPDLALVSSCLPHESGVQIARLLRSKNPDLVVILMEDASPEREVCDSSPAVSARLPRPFRFEALRAILDSLQLAPAPAE